ncbi:uncharacterized protein H6S33_009382 [Morchella sextelata]|uniref:uncharacterized protein n=1 Tax=Morchella sextelata TaxID=1174677 RepID=UPI001D057D6B|nr:uncharacterized protein H6S33_009382 [Morchella sextelata]KAH0613002.1 hypothetical protein H6S33_009382 [Morchella sextelata]
MDAPEDRDVKLQKVSGGLLAQFDERLPQLLQTEDGEGGRRRRSTVDSLISLIEPFQESPQLLDPYLQSYLTQLTEVFLAQLPKQSTAPPESPSEEEKTSFNSPLSLHDGVSKLLYTLCKIRGPKIISRFLPNEPRWLEPLCVFATAETPDRSWELRYVLLLWLSHLLLTPFDLSTISDPSIASPALPEQLDLPNLPSLSRRLLALGITHLSSPGNRESDAASLLLDRLCLRKDMRALGLLSALVTWCLNSFKPSTAATTMAAASNTLFMKTAILRVLAGILAQGDREIVSEFAPRIFTLAKKLEAVDGEEWNSANVRRLGMKIYRWVAILSLAPEGEEDGEEGGNVVEDIVERLLSCLGDKDTAVRFGASKSLAVISRKLPPDLAGEVLEAVMGIYEEDVFYYPAHGENRQKILSAVTAEKWHGATLTLATFLRQRAVRSTDVLERVVRSIIDSLHFEQRRATFALGGNVRDAACYAAWSLARSYTTDELLAVGDIDGHGNVQQLLATELAVAGCLDPLGNIRRAASAALQELIGRHPNTTIEGIRVVQVVDYNAVALRRRSVITVAEEIASLAAGYWNAIMGGIVEGWRGVGSSDLDGRKLSGLGLREVVIISLPGDDEEARGLRARKVLNSLVHRIRTEGKSDVEIWHGGTWALAEVLDGLSTLTSTSSLFTPSESKLLLENVFEKLVGKEFVNPILRPELTSEAASRLVSALSSSSHLFSQQGDIPAKTLRLWTAIIEASLDRNDDIVLAQAVPATKFLFGILSPKNRQAIIETWCRRASSTGKKRGYVLALGEVIGFVYSTDTALKDKIVGTLVSAAERDGEVELRVAGVRALGCGVIAREGLKNEAVAKVVLKALDDYEVDSRGDVGSWARAEGIKAIFENWGGEGWNGDVKGVPEWEILKRLVRLSAERLDRMRARACEALLKISASWEESELESYLDRPKLASDLAANSISSKEYFQGVMPLLQHPRLKVEFLKGYVTAAGAGSDSLLKTSRSVLLEYLTSVSASPSSYVSTIVETMLQVLEENTSDRIVIPALEVIAAVLEMKPLGTPGTGPQIETTELLKRLFVMVQKIQFKSGNPLKLSAAVRAYSGIIMAAESEELRKKVLVKLVSMLLHPFPKLRELVAETLYIHGHFLGSEAIWGASGRGKEEVVEKILVDGDWLGGVKELRKGVGVLKGILEA